MYFVIPASASADIGPIQTLAYTTIDRIDAESDSLGPGGFPSALVMIQRSNIVRKTWYQGDVILDCDYRLI